MGNAEQMSQLDAGTFGERQLWASQILLTPLDTTMPSDEQLNEYRAYAEIRSHRDIMKAEVELSTVQPEITGRAYSRWGLSFLINATRAIDVMEISALNAVRGLREAGVAVGDLEFVDAHIQTTRKMDQTTAARQAIDPNLPAARIVDEQFKASDSLRRHARQAFYSVRNTAVALDCFDHSAEIVQRAHERRAVPRLTVNAEQ